MTDHKQGWQHPEVAKLFEILRNIYVLQKIEKIKILNNNQEINVSIFLSFVAWLTEGYGKQKVEKESIKIKITKPFNNL